MLDLDLEDYSHNDGIQFVKNAVNTFKVRDIIYHISFYRRNNAQFISTTMQYFATLPNKVFIKFSDTSLQAYDLKELLGMMTERKQLGLKLGGGCESDNIIRQIWGISQLTQLEYFKFEYTCTCKWDRDKLVYQLARALSQVPNLKKLELVVKKIQNYPTRENVMESIRNAISVIKNLKVLDINLINSSDKYK